LAKDNIEKIELNQIIENEERRKRGSRRSRSRSEERNLKEI